MLDSRSTFRPAGPVTDGPGGPNGGQEVPDGSRGHAHGATRQNDATTKQQAKETEMETKTYNGWTNYETWNWFLWHGNDIESDFGDIVRDCERDAHKVSKALEEWTEELAECYKTPENGFFADILQAALSEVDWYEIAEHIIDEIETEDAVITGAEGEGE